jgi:hypothetical protein
MPGKMQGESRETAAFRSPADDRPPITWTAADKQELAAREAEFPGVTGGSFNVQLAQVRKPEKSALTANSGAKVRRCFVSYGILSAHAISPVPHSGTPISRLNRTAPILLSQEKPNVGPKKLLFPPEASTSWQQNLPPKR